MDENIKDFLNYCAISSGQSTLNKIQHKLKIINEFYKGKLDDLKLEDLHNFLAHLNKSRFAKATRNDAIKILKRFLKWKYPDWSKRFNDLKDAKLNGNSQRQLSKEDLLTPEEMKLIINSIDSMKYKTLLLFFQETACRPEEVLKLKWKDINLDKGEVKLHSSKTDKIRTIPIKNTLEHLRRYRLECFAITPTADNNVFDISNQAVLEYLNKIEKKLNFSKHLYPYLWRHSILSRMIKTLSPKVYEMYAGHSLETGMGVYAHLDNEDLRNELFEKVYKIEKLTEEDKTELLKLKQKIQKQEIFNKELTAKLLDLRKDLVEMTGFLQKAKKRALSSEKTAH